MEAEMNIYLIILLRTIHIFSGVLWVGSAIFYIFLVKPTVKALGPAGPTFMGYLVTKQRLPLFMNTVALLTILSGIPLFIFVSGGLRIAWITTGPGIGFTIGSLVGIGVFFLGFLMIKPRGERLSEIGKEIAMAGRPPTFEQTAELEKIDQELSQVERLDFVLLTIALFTMATARYWSF
jgi:uncharacterized membrane protein